MKTISFIGAQGVGKTFTAKRLKEQLEGDGYTVHYGYLSDNSGLSISRRIKKLGFPINEETTFLTQYAIMLNYLKEDIETRKVAEPADYLIYDRSPFDQLVYSLVSLNPNDSSIIKDSTFYHMKRYPLDHIFWMSPLPTLEKDEFRSPNREFQKKIDVEFDDLIVNSDLINRDTLCHVTEVKDLQKRANHPYNILNIVK